MLETAAGMGRALVLVWVVLFVHELGHYYTGRQIVGIPADDIKLVSPLFPRYVALRDGSGGRDGGDDGGDGGDGGGGDDGGDGDGGGDGGDEDGGGGEWVSPHEFDRYRECYERHDPEYEHMERYVAGGEIIQTLVVVPAAVALAFAGFAAVAANLLVLSILVTLIYVVLDAVWSRRTGAPAGDYSALWAVSPRIPALLLVGFLFVHLAAFFFVV